MIDNKKGKRSLDKFISMSVLFHLTVIAFIACGGFLAERDSTDHGDNAIKAVMIDLSLMAAPEQVLVETTPQVEGIADSSMIDNKVTEIEPESESIDIVEEDTPDISVEKESLDKSKMPVTPAELVVKEMPSKPKPKVKPKAEPPVQKSSQAQVKQEIALDNTADTTVAPTISVNTQYSSTPTPISRHQPEYPRRALDMRIEGHVVVRYDIDKSGNVENIRIVESKPTNIFNRSVISAMKGWKYQSIVAKDLTIKIIFNRNQTIQLENT